jgi:hypothetical protein
MSLCILVREEHAFIPTYLSAAWADTRRKVFSILQLETWRIQYSAMVVIYDAERLACVDKKGLS